MGEGASEVRLARPGPVHVTAKVAALLPEIPDMSIRNRPYDQKPYWSLERARLGDSRMVPVELIVNGQTVARRELKADGSLQPISFEHDTYASSWIALRILPSSHTNPIFVDCRRQADTCTLEHRVVYQSRGTMCCAEAAAGSIIGACRRPKSVQPRRQCLQDAYFRKLLH